MARSSSARWASIAAQPLAGEGDGAGDLRRLLVADVVEVEELADVLEREAEALALQDQLQPRPAAAGVEPLLSDADRGDQLLRLVEAQGPRGDAEGGAHLADGLEIVAHGYDRSASVHSRAGNLRRPGDAAQGAKLTFAST